MLLLLAGGLVWPTLGWSVAVTTRAVRPRPVNFTVARIHSVTLSLAVDEDNDDDPLLSDRPLSSSQNPLYSLEALALAVSLFFVAVTTVLGGDLFATSHAPMPPSVDADALLEQDFLRDETSVKF